jgi:nitrite reductase/ring-hydroxylating ferredoxin subunit
MTSTVDLPAPPRDRPDDVPRTAAAQQTPPAGWWAVAAGADLRDTPLAARLFDQDLALYRDGSGTVRAVDDLCPHRRLPLSLGRVTDGQLQCGYHGWTFDGQTGRCTVIPNLSAKEKPSPRTRLPVFATAESDGLVLVSLVPEPEAVDAPAGSPDLTYALTVRSPHDSVVRALAWNPGAALGLGAVLGAGEQDTTPSTAVVGDRLEIRRVRQTLGVRRLATYGHIVDRRTRTTVSLPATGGIVEITGEDGLLGTTARVVAGVQPLSGHTCRVHVAVTLSGPPAGVRALRTALQLAAAVARRTGRSRGHAEAVSDEADRRGDPDLAALAAHRASSTAAIPPAAPAVPSVTEGVAL